MSKNITKITLSEEDKLYLQSLSKTRTIQAQVVDRARIILFKADGKTDKFISEGLGIGLSTVRRCIEKYIDLPVQYYPELLFPQQVYRPHKIPVHTARDCIQNHRTRF